jgi:hypothetical protein
MFQYNNEFFELKTNAEIRGWIADRKKAYPTAAKIAAKKAEQKALDEMRRRQREQRTVNAGQEAKAAKKLARKLKREKQKERRKRKAQQNQRKAEQSHPLLETDSTAGALLEAGPLPLSTDVDAAAEKSSDVNPSSEGDLQTNAAAAIKVENDEDCIKPNSAASSSSDESSASGEDSDISSDDDSNDDDATPDEKTSKRAPKPAQQSIKPRKAPIFSAPCKYYIRDGSCRRSDCRYSHDVDRTRTLTLFQRVSTSFQRHPNFHA